MARPALAVGVALVSLETLNDIGASEYLGVRTLTVSIFTTWLNRGSLAGAAQLVAGSAGDRGAADRDRALSAAATSATEFSAESPRLTLRTPLAGIKRAGSAFAACLLPVLLGFVRAAAVSAAARACAAALFAKFDLSLWRDALHSVALAAIATLLALALGLIVVLARRWRPDRLRLRRDERSRNSATRCPDWCWRSACWRRCWRSTTR